LKRPFYNLSAECREMARRTPKLKQTLKVQTVVRSLEGRLAKIEQELAEVEANERLNTCICGNKAVVVTVAKVEEFRTEMNRLCPVHGFRELKIMHVTIGPRVDEPEVEEALNEYYARLEESKRRRPEND
jgi:hypothetical protein